MVSVVSTRQLALWRWRVPRSVRLLRLLARPYSFQVTTGLSGGTGLLHHEHQPVFRVEHGICLVQLHSPFDV